jgi:hypothetical protein
MKIKVLADADSVAREAAALIATEARTVVAERDRFIIAVSADPSIPAGRVNQDRALVLADRAPEKQTN